MVSQCGSWYNNVIRNAFTTILKYVYSDLWLHYVNTYILSLTTKHKCLLHAKHEQIFNFYLCSTVCNPNPVYTNLNSCSG